MNGFPVNPGLPIWAHQRALPAPFALALYFSKLISGELDEQMDKSRKFARYLPFWA